jgi:hypothetical protein
MVRILGPHSSQPTADVVYCEPGTTPVADLHNDSNDAPILGAKADQSLQTIPARLLGPGSLDEDLIKWILQPEPQELTSKRRRKNTSKTKVDSGKTSVPALRPKSTTGEMTELVAKHSASISSPLKSNDGMALKAPASKVEKKTRKRQKRTVHE